MTNRAVEAEADKDDEADEAHKADDAEVDEADEANKAVAIDDAANKADDAGAGNVSVAEKAHVISEAIASDVAIEANAEADEEAEADLANDAAGVVEADANNAGVSVEMPLLFPFSLTKHSAIFAEVKGFFDFLDVNHNQHGRAIRNGG